MVKNISDEKPRNHGSDFSWRTLEKKLTDQVPLQSTAAASYKIVYAAITGRISGIPLHSAWGISPESAININPGPHSWPYSRTNESDPYCDSPPSRGVLIAQQARAVGGFLDTPRGFPFLVSSGVECQPWVITRLFRFFWLAISCFFFGFKYFHDLQLNLHALFF